MCVSECGSVLVYVWSCWWDAAWRGRGCYKFFFTGMKYFQHKEIALNISGRITFARSSTCLDTEKVYLLMIAAIIEGKFHFLHKAKTAAQMSEQNHNILLHGPGQD